MSTKLVATGNADCCGELDGIMYCHTQVPTGTFTVTSERFYVGGCTGWDSEAGEYNHREDYDPCGTVVTLTKGQTVRIQLDISSDIRTPDTVWVTLCG